MVTTLTQFRVIVVTDPQTNTPTDKGDYNTLRRSFASTQCNETLFANDSKVKKRR